MKRILLILIVVFSLDSYSQQFNAEEQRYFGYYFTSGMVYNIINKEAFKMNDFWSYSSNLTLTNTISVINKDNISVILLNNVFNLAGIWISNKLLNNYHKTEKQKAQDKLKLIYDE